MSIATGAEPPHSAEAPDVVVALGTDVELGLTEREAADRQREWGRNELPTVPERGPLHAFALQFHNPLVYVLLAAVAVTMAVGEVVDASVIAGVVIINAIVGFVQERRASRALAALASLSQTWTRVVRAGRVERVDSRELVPGDIVLVEAGDRVPADVRWERVRNLQVDESALTGESEPVDKRDHILPGATLLADRINMGYCGTLVTAGSGRAVVVATGGDSEIGHIQTLVGSAREMQTPLTRRIAGFSRWLTIVIIALAGLTFGVGVVRGESVSDMVTAAVALAVGAIPEGLPAAVTIVLAIGVSRMAGRNAIIRRLPAAETLGSTTVVCTDKTGTLTQNAMTVQWILVGGARFPADECPLDAATPCLTVGALCSNAHLIDDPDAGLRATGDPTETALVMSAARRGIDQRDLRREWPMVDELPFSSDAGYMATVHRSAATGERRLLVKGGVEAVLPLCRRQLVAPGTIASVDRPAVMADAAGMAHEALRVLAFAETPVPDSWSLSDGLPADLVLVGLQAMADPVRPESGPAVAACQQAGIAVMMITGDHPRTGQAIAEQVGLMSEGRSTVLTGVQVTEMDDDQLATAVEDVAVFARVTADQKLRIVEALQRRGHVVAVTGDGINDAPALKQADIGIAMGYGGTEAAKEAADMVLADDDFATIEAAVEEGRTIYDNLVKFVTWTLPTNIGEGLVILTAIVIGSDLPITPVQILWINMTTAVALGLMLAFEPAEPSIMVRPPRSTREPLLTRTVVVRIALVGALMLVGAFGIFAWVLAGGGSVEVARTAAVNAFVAMEIGYLVNCRSLTSSVWSVGLFSNRWLLLGVLAMVALQGLFTYAPFMQAAFGSAPLTPDVWLVIVLAGVMVSVIVGATKARARHARGRSASAVPLA